MTLYGRSHTTERPTAPGGQPTPEDAPFLRAVAERPDDDLPRLVYADWLDERGDPRADLIRTCHEAACLPAGDPRRRGLAARERQLWLAHRDEWLAPLHRLGALGASFHRGVPACVAMTVSRFLEYSRALFETIPTVRGLLIVSARRDGVRELAPCPAVRKLETLDFAFSSIDDVGAWHLSQDCVSLGRLRCLRLCGNALTAAGAEALAASPRLAGNTPVALRDLDLAANRLGDAGAEAITASPAVRAVHRLNLAFNAIGDDGARAVAASPMLGQLRDLDLSGNPIGAGGVRAILASPRLAHLRRLSVDDDWPGRQVRRVIRRLRPEIDLVLSPRRRG